MDAPSASHKLAHLFILPVGVNNEGTAAEPLCHAIVQKALAVTEGDTVSAKYKYQLIAELSKTKATSLYYKLKRKTLYGYSKKVQKQRTCWWQICERRTVLANKIFCLSVTRRMKNTNTWRCWRSICVKQRRQEQRNNNVAGCRSAAQG